MKIFTMTKTVTRNLAQGPATRMYPQRARVYTPITRGRIENAIDRCIFCGLCARRCPTNAIVVGKEGKEWQIDRLKCCICNLCVEVCPVKCLSTDNHYAPSVTARENAIHLEKLTISSSGEETGKAKDTR
ncbi:MAG TPA: 4Fe-4S binding protein [Desulfuromonadales bacterium]|jgi:formate hydrogenlyase subunit 6/NADH:ubiquinone oxidoreductase subunit I